MEDVQHHFATRIDLCVGEQRFDRKPVAQNMHPEKQHIVDEHDIGLCR